VAIGVAIATLLGGIAVHPVAGVGGFVLLMVGFFLFEKYGYSLRCPYCGSDSEATTHERTVAEGKAARLRELNGRIDEELAREDWASDLRLRLGDRVVFVRCEGSSSDRLAIGSQLSADRLATLAISEGIVADARTRGFVAMIYRGCIEHEKYDEVESKYLTADRTTLKDIEAALRVLEEKDVRAVDLQVRG